LIDLCVRALQIALVLGLSLVPALAAKADGHHVPLFLLFIPEWIVLG
jgi:hypothetical protein